MSFNVFYGCAKRHRIEIPNVFVLTNDIDKKCYCNYTCDIKYLLNRDFLDLFDALIFTPPCNYYSRANYRRETSKVAQETKDLLPLILSLLTRWYPSSNYTPWIVENVQNSTLLQYMYPKYQHTLGGHTYWTNMDGFEFNKYRDLMFKQNKQNLNRERRDGNVNVNTTFIAFLEYCMEL